jgi:hypothetical protein
MSNAIPQLGILFEDFDKIKCFATSLVTMFLSYNIFIYLILLEKLQKLYRIVNVYETIYIRNLSNYVIMKSLQLLCH